MHLQTLYWLPRETPLLLEQATSADRIAYGRASFPDALGALLFTDTDSKAH